MIHKNPLISVIIPSYNYAEYLPDTVRSVLQQTGGNYELIIINDGSTDTTDDVIQALLQETKNSFSYYRQKNIGVSATRNKGIKLAKGDYIYFLDSDDKMLEDALDTFSRSIKKQPSADMLIARYFSVYNDGRKKERCLWSLSYSQEENFKSYLLNVDNSLLCSSILFKKKAFDNYQFPECLRIYEDEPVFAYMLANFNVIKIDKPVALVQKHSNSLRHQVYHGLVEQSVDEIFNPSRIPGNLMSYRSHYLGLKYLDQFRTLYIAGEYEKAWSQYLKALPCNKKAALKVNVIRKAIKSWLKK
ncbi:MAG: glycosyltransferase family 2 protein [Candidatus Endonucleobacter bathymodioli]|uniref:Glycosyltransferase family 2 protein n=1 Tax=Candidatus Endonucleibacter bathymodioli TaxID=539814 RepID=A0AA90STI9_9GAMM|nr:glycosyltransferase family 2 protein [Candidatus Endonucleobacter bathymodioli]